MPSAKKYKLFSIKKDGGVKPVCAFFLRGDCRNGETCPFSHEQEGGPKEGRHVEFSDAASVISSESEDDKSSDSAKDMPRLDHEREKSRTKRKDILDNNCGDPFASPPLKGSAIESTSSRKRKNKKRHASNIQHEDETESRSSNKNPLNNQGQTQKSSQNSSASGSGDYQSFASHLPVASFSTAITNNGTRGGELSSVRRPKKLEKRSHFAEPEDEELPLPTSTEGGGKWKAAVLRTREHDRYNSSFDFASYKQKHREAGIQSDWIKARKFGQWCSSNPQVIAIDCEMCETQDPLSGSKNAKALCRISVVNAECPDEVLLDTLVKPNWPVSDHRTRINGIKKEHLDNVQFTLRHAQAFMMALCSDETVIVGHAVQNDLVALHMEHHCIADSSFLFHSKDSRNAAVSLRDLVSTIFQEKMPDTHDSVNDARKALSCVEHWVKNSGNVSEILRSTNNARSTQLFVHRVPKYCKSQNVFSMFQKHTDIVPEEVDDIEFSGTTGKTYVTFRTPMHAKLAFDTLDGTAETDKSGRLQKKVYLKNGDYVRIRKMVHEKLVEEANLDGKLLASP